MEKILIVAHDSGGAEVISAWVKNNPSDHYSFVLSGPALNIFEKKINPIHIESPKNLMLAVIQADTILTGTSWTSDLEQQAILLAKQYSKKAITYLDHWCDYVERFERDGRRILPDEIWVGDQYAFDIARKCFPDTKILLTTNYYFQEIKADLATQIIKRGNTKLNLLYICEPIADYAEKKFGSVYYFNYTESEALHYCIDKIAHSDYAEKIASFRLRPHPSEPKGKYQGQFNKNAHFDINISAGSTLFEDISWSDWIIGCSSMALVIGVLADKKVFTCIPPKAKVFKLPHQEIKPLPESKIEYG